MPAERRRARAVEFATSAAIVARRGTDGAGDSVSAPARQGGKRDNDK